MILLTKAENSIDRACEQLGSFKGSKNYKESAANNQKERVKI